MKKEEQIFSKLLEIVDIPKQSDIDIRKYINYIFKLAVGYYNLDKISYKYSKLKDNQFGSFSTKTNSIELNKNLLSKNSDIAKITVTIFHETRHFFQSKHYHFEIDSQIIPQMPVFYCPSTVFLIDKEALSIDPFDVYYTSFLEKDARDYALKNAKKVFNYLYNNVKDSTAKKSFLTYLNSLEYREKKEQETYVNSMYNLTFNKQIIKEKVTKEIDKAIKMFNDNPLTNFSQMIRSFCGNIILYCDENIKNKIKLAFKPYVSNPKILPYYAVLFNYLLWNTSKKDIDELFAIVYKNNIELDTILEVMTYFDKDDLKKRYDNFIKEYGLGKQVSPIEKMTNEF